MSLESNECFLSRSGWEDLRGQIGGKYDCDIKIISYINYNYMLNKLYGINRRYNAFLSLNSLPQIL